MSARVLQFGSTFHVTWQAHCIHRVESEQHLQPDWPRKTITSAEFNGLCKESLLCLREPKDPNTLLESVWVRLCYWLEGEANQLPLPEMYEHRTTILLQEIGDLLEAKLCDLGREDRRDMRLVLDGIRQGSAGKNYEM